MGAGKGSKNSGREGNYKFGNSFIGFTSFLQACGQFIRFSVLWGKVAGESACSDWPV